MDTFEKKGDHSNCRRCNPSIGFEPLRVPILEDVKGAPVNPSHTDHKFRTLWEVDKTKNPLTGRKIKNGGPTCCENERRSADIGSRISEYVDPALFRVRKLRELIEDHKKQAVWHERQMMISATHACEAITFDAIVIKSGEGALTCRTCNHDCAISDNNYYECRVCDRAGENYRSYDESQCECSNSRTLACLTCKWSATCIFSKYTTYQTVAEFVKKMPRDADSLVFRHNV